MIALRTMLAVLLLVAVTLGARAAAKCEIGQVAALPVHVTPSRILLDGKINGQDVEIILDTGAQSSMIFADAAHRLGIALHDVDGSGQGWGAGGVVMVHRVQVRDLTFGDIHLTDLSFWAGGGTGGEAKVAMLLGQDVLSNWNVEYDLAHGAIRLLHPQGCRGDDVVYWADGYHRAPMHSPMYSGQVIDINVGLNRANVLATLDTGAPETTLTPEAAMRAGVLRRLDKVKGEEVGGMGAFHSDVGAVDLDTLSVGGEVVQHPRIRVSNMFAHAVYERTGRLTGERADTPDMLLGLDWVRAHRLLVAPDQNMVYFTYAGGPVFAPVPQREPAK